MNKKIIRRCVIMKIKVNGSISVKERINRILESIEEDEGWTEVMLAILPVFEEYREWDYYIPNDEDGLMSLLDRLGMESFVGVIKSDEYDMYDDLIRYYNGDILSVGYDVVYQDLKNLIANKEYTNEMLEALTDILEEFEI
jgi:hypothetical protein